jgi:hypothetical protein
MFDSITLLIWNQCDDIVRTNGEVSIADDSCIRFYHDAIIFATSFAFAQDTPYDEEHMAQHDGVYKKWNTVIHGFMSHRQMMPVFLLLITIVRQTN